MELGSGGLTVWKTSGFPYGTPGMAWSSECPYLSQGTAFRGSSIMILTLSCDEVHGYPHFLPSSLVFGFCSVWLV